MNTAARALLVRAARTHSLGAWAPFVHPLLLSHAQKGHVMAKLSLAQKLSQGPRVVALVSPKLDTMMESYQMASAKASQYDAKKKAIGKEVCAIVLDKAGKQGVVETENYKATHVPGESRTLSVQKLLAAGVSAKIIDACYDKTPWEYPRISAKKATPDNDVDDLTPVRVDSHMRRIEKKGKR